MNDHQSWQEQIAPYAASRLEGDALRRLETHLEECRECRELAETWREIAAAISDAGEDLFDPHPSPATLARLAGGETAAGDDRMRRHLAICPACGLELEAWKDRTRPAKSPHAPMSLRPSPWAARLLWAAAGLVIGVGLGFLGLFPPGENRPGNPPAAEGGRALRHLLLPRVQRGGSEAVRFEIGPGESFLIVDFQPPPPPETNGDARFRFEIVHDDGAVAWSSAMPAAAMRDHLEAMELVSFLVPTDHLPPGRYEFRVQSPETNGRPPWYRVPAEIVHSR